MPPIVLVPEEFGFFDPQAEYTVTYGNLPHWEQESATQFITFRTADSIPRATMDLWIADRNAWLVARNIDPHASGWGSQFARLSRDIQRTFHREFTAKLERHLDDLSGECLLARRGIADIVADSLRYFDGVRYHLGDFIVMPNHVHLIACFINRFSMRAQCHSWKRFTARRINQELGRTGHLWQTESFDHLIRDDEHFGRFQRYIHRNAEQARNHGSRYLHWGLRS